MTKDRRSRALKSQIKRLERRTEELQNRSNRYSWVRLSVVVAGVLVSAIVFFVGLPQWFWAPLALAILIFLLVVYFHRQIERSLIRHKIWLDIKNSQIARMDLDWDGIPPAAFEPETALELDLDLTGSYSLHRLINTAGSPGGSALLQEWLAANETDPAETIRRQNLVRELAPLSLFRDKLFLNGTYARRGNGDWQTEQLLKWLQQNPLPSSMRLWLIVLGILALLNISFFLLAAANLLPPLWQITLTIYALLFLIRSRELGEPFRESTRIRDVLEQLGSVFLQLENFNYGPTPHLKSLCDAFLDRGQRPSLHLKRINRVVYATGVRGNPFVWLLLNIIGPWDYFFALQLDKHKAAIAGRLPIWLDLWFELEALGSLANLAYLNPQYTFPVIEQEDRQASEPVLKAVALGHPMIPDDERVCNDFSADKIGEVALFTGSNMSGKSTFLRTVGINLVLAFAGGPVNAQLFSTSHFRLYTCIRITDSIATGVSYFYAEVKCLKGLLEELAREDSLPLFYFIDEIFRGTNNRERLIGSRAYIQAVAGQSGVGLIATHDLELVQLADEIPPIRNFHFTDKVSYGRMAFDYILQPGPSPTTNAVKIMRMEGLPV